jgi:hypothetical protein
MGSALAGPWFPYGERLAGSWFPMGSALVGPWLVPMGSAWLVPGSLMGSALVGPWFPMGALGWSLAGPYGERLVNLASLTQNAITHKIAKSIENVPTLRSL